MIMRYVALFQVWSNGDAMVMIKCLNLEKKKEKNKKLKAKVKFDMSFLVW